MFHLSLLKYTKNVIHSWPNVIKNLFVKATGRLDVGTMKEGVPQGSILGPQLFIVSVNDLFGYLFPENDIWYAHDPSLLSSVTSLEAMGMSHIVDRTEVWFTQIPITHSPHLRHNVKTQQIFFTTKGNPTEILKRM